MISNQVDTDTPTDTLEEWFSLADELVTIERKVSQLSNNDAAKLLFDHRTRWRELRERLGNRLLLWKVRDGVYFALKEEYEKTSGGFQQVWFAHPMDGLADAEYSFETISREIDDLRSLYPGGVVTDEHEVDALRQTGEIRVKQFVFG